MMDKEVYDVNAKTVLGFRASGPSGDGKCRVFYLIW